MSETGDDPGHSAAGGRFFEGADFGRRLHLLQHLTQSSDLVLVVSGPAGSGKSTLLAQLLTVTDKRWRFCTVHATRDMRANDALRKLARCCGLPEDCGETVWSHLLAEQAISLVNDDRVPVVAVDDAHLLENAALASLVRLGTPGEANPQPWHLLLFSEPGLEATLVNGKDKLPAISKLHILRLNPLSLEETADYVGHRLEGTALLSAEQIKRLHRDSEGLPGKIDALLAAGSAAASVQKRTAPPEEPASSPPPAGRRRRGRYIRAVGVAVLAVAIGLVLTYQDQINALFQTRHSRPPAPAAPPTPPPTIALPPTPQTPAEATAGKATTPAPSRAIPTAITPPAPKATSAAQPLPQSQPPVAANATVQVPTAAEPKSKQPKPAAHVETRGSVRNTGSATQKAPVGTGLTAPQETSGPVATAAPAAPATRPPPATAGLAAGEPAAPTTTKTPPQPDLSASPARQQPARMEHSAKPAGGGAGHGAKWLLAQDPDRYTMQLVASWHEQTVRKYLQHHHLEGDSAFYHVLYHGKTWYVLIFGVYDDLKEVRTALHKLPAAVRRDRPWIRRLRAVQAELKRGHK